MLKSLLSLLLSKFYSKQESGEVAHQAMPGASSTVLLSNGAVSDWGTVSSGVAAADGYLVLAARNAGSKAASLSLNVGEVARQSLTYPFAGAGGNTFVPVGKGDSWELLGSSSDSITLELYKTIGGGDQALNQLLLQGGVLCRLSRLYSSLRRSSCRVRRNGSEVKVFSQAQIPEQRSLLTTLRLSFIRLQVMDGLHSAETGHRSMSALPESWERVALTLKVISELQLRFGRGIPLVSIARQTISNRLRQNSFPAKGQRNTSLVGGASC